MRQLADFFSGLPFVGWLGAIWNTLKQLSIVLSFLFVFAVCVYFVPTGFSAGERLAILGGVFFLILVTLLIIGLLTALPGDRVYAPSERLPAYGTNERPRRRKEVIAEAAVSSDEQLRLETPNSANLPPGGGS